MSNIGHVGVIQTSEMYLEKDTQVLRTVYGDGAVIFTD